MNTLSKVIAYVKNTLGSVQWKNPKVGIPAAAIVVLLGAGIFYFVHKGGSSNQVAADQLASVTLIDVSKYAHQGTVKETDTGTREIVVRAEMSGKVTSVAKAGDRVGLGQIVAEFENSSQRAALLQAEGSVDSAQAALSRVHRGAREEQQSILGTNVESAQLNLSTAKDAAVTTLNSAYAAIDDAVRRKTDPMFSNPDSGAPHLTVQTSESQTATAAENARVSISPILSREASLSQSLTSSSDLSAELTTTEAELRLVRSYIDSLLLVLNKAIPAQSYSDTQIGTFKSDAAAARANVSASISALTAARETLVNRTSALEVAQKTQAQGATPDEADILSASASVKQSQGSYAAALAGYQKTIVRAPSAGTVISCSPEVGDVITTGADVCRINASGSASGTSFLLPLSSVKYTPAGAFVFIIDADGTVESKAVETGLVSADSIAVAGLFGDERIIRDVRGLREGEKVEVTFE